MPSDIKGLTSSEAQELLRKYGPNKIPEAKPPSDFRILLNQLKSPLVYVLLAAAIVTFTLGEYADTTIIFVAVFINTILGFVQERRANNALTALKKMIQPQAIVIRDVKRITIDASGIVPGDVCIINQGDKIPADGTLIESHRLYANEAVLTGESLPVRKEKGGNLSMGTIATSGNGLMEVTKTGAQTDFGKIAQDVQRPDELTPLGLKLKELSRQLSILVVVLVVIVFVIGVLVGDPLVEVFTTSVALAVSAIPEGLLVALTVVLAIGMQRILKRKGLVRNLVSAETLGSVTYICIDKTGTITRGQMQVTHVEGDKSEIANQLLIANDLDDPMLIAAYEWASKQGIPVGKDKRLDSLPFSADERFFACLVRGYRKNKIYINGAPDSLVDWSNLNSTEKNEIRKLIDKYAEGGNRLIGLAKKEVSKSKKNLKSRDVKSDLSWVGLVVFSDPARKDAGKVFDKTAKAGIETIIITGDYAQTAMSIMKSIGVEIDSTQVMLGDELKRINSNALAEKLGNKEIRIFARTTPNQKLKIVKALKQNGEVVAMMGDGVNDAPALKAADIGIVVGSATDVAKESSDLVLIDSNFETILAAVEEGRGIFDNIRKIISYLLSDSFEEIVAVVGSLILSVTLYPGLPIPVLAAQILWINLVSDGFPHLALTVDPKSPDVLSRSPRNPDEPLVASWMRYLIAVVSVTGGLVALSLFVFYYTNYSDIRLAQSITFAVLGINSLFYVFSIRALTKPVWKTSIFENKWLNIAVLAGLVMQIFPFLFPATRELLKITQLHITDWFVIILASMFMFIMIEVVKAFARFQQVHK